MKVTNIKKQVKSQGRYSIFIDGKFAFGLSELGLINSGIKIGLELSSSEILELRSAADTDKIHGKVLGLLARRPRSRWELEDYLKRNKIDSVQIAKVLQFIEERGYVDDEDFARRWVENRRLLKSTSKRKLQLELRQRRVSDEIIQQVLADDDSDEKTTISELIAKKRTQSRYKDDQKLIAYLVRQGFNYADIKDCLK